MQDRLIVDERGSSGPALRSGQRFVPTSAKHDIGQGYVTVLSSLCEEVTEHPGSDDPVHDRGEPALGVGEGRASDDFDDSGVLGSEAGSYGGIRPVTMKCQKASVCK